LNFKDSYGSLDRLLHDIAFRTGNAQQALADLEEFLYKKLLKGVQLHVPVFITALPRSGTTILLQLLYDSGHFASHTYRDMPFVLCPLLWSRFSSRFAGNDQPKERAHGDGLQISTNSPEAFEEMIWKHFWPDHYTFDRIIPWTSIKTNIEFERFLESNMRKVIALRQQESMHPMRYVSKNNFNIARLASVPGPLSRGIFLIPFRDPVQNAASMLLQHIRFTRLHEEDDFVRRYMEAIGHHEFGKGLRPIDFGGWLDRASPPNQLDFWVQYWIAAYRHVLDHTTPSMRLICYADLTAEPKEALARLATAIGVPASDLTSQGDRLRPPRNHDVRESDISAGLREEAGMIYQRLKQQARE
jgi:hypothetical protein